jgi:hypothetical protein
MWMPGDTVVQHYVVCTLQTAIDFDSSPVSRTYDGIFYFKALSFLDKS